MLAERDEGEEVLGWRPFVRIYYLHNKRRYLQIIHKVMPRLRPGFAKKRGEGEGSGFPAVTHDSEIPELVNY
jgi:hypothetical protein